MATKSFCPIGKIMLAPMVRISTHPMRLLALQNGADYVFCEELIDQRVMRSTRIVNIANNTTDFLLPDGSVVFRTSREESGRVIAQLGTSNPIYAVEAAKLLENDVLAIDINMGCPKDYSIKGGMGAALLTEPQKVKKLLSCLVSSLNVPVTCKIRILPKLEDTLVLAKIIENTGVAAITVHARTPAERSGSRNHDEVIRAISETVSIPVIANGGSRETIRIFEDIEYFRQQTGACGVMIGRAAMWNPAIFLDPACGRPLPTLHETVREYLTLAVRYDHHLMGTKYCIQQMLHCEGDSTLFLQTVGSRSLEQLCSVWGLDDVYRQETTSRLERLGHLHSKRSATDSQDITSAPKRNYTSPAVADAEVIVPMDVIRRSVPYEHRFWVDQRESPKHLLFEYSKKHQLTPPEYHTNEDREARLFYSTVAFMGKRFENTIGCKSKKHSEQAAALVCIDVLGVRDGTIVSK